MNWTKIQTDYPQAFAKLLEWIDTGWCLSEESGEPIVWGSSHYFQVGSTIEFWQNGYYEGAYHYNVDLRRLYDFFDEHGINCHVSNYPDGGSLSKWDWTIKIPLEDFRSIHVKHDSATGDTPYPEGYDWFDSRTKCEAYVFDRAFELLEKRF